jgi:hypothetical protein
VRDELDEEFAEIIDTVEPQSSERPLVAAILA